ncbi:MAG: endo-1,4-beta-xylanase, partial [Planctomycetota bacterium]
MSERRSSSRRTAANRARQQLARRAAERAAAARAEEEAAAQQPPAQPQRRAAAPQQPAQRRAPAQPGQQQPAQRRAPSQPGQQPPAQRRAPPQQPAQRRAPAAAPQQPAVEARAGAGRSRGQRRGPDPDERQPRSRRSSPPARERRSPLMLLVAVAVVAVVVGGALAVVGGGSGDDTGGSQNHGDVVEASGSGTSGSDGDGTAGSDARAERIAAAAAAAAQPLVLAPALTPIAATADSAWQPRSSFRHRDLASSGVRLGAPLFTDWQWISRKHWATVDVGKDGVYRVQVQRPAPKLGGMVAAESGLAFSAGDKFLLRMKVRVTDPTLGLDIYADWRDDRQEKWLSLIHHHIGPQFGLPVGEWFEVCLPVEIDKDIPADKLRCRMDLVVPGAEVPKGAEVEVAELTCTLVDADFYDLPFSGARYQGREPWAPWRTAAAERIERLRAAPLTVTVVDGDGLPLPNAKVHISQQRHAFEFGNACRVVAVIDDGPQGDAYRRAFLDLFNAAGTINATKWKMWSSDAGRVERYERQLASYEKMSAQYEKAKANYAKALTSYERAVQQGNKKARKPREPREPKKPTRQLQWREQVYAMGAWAAEHNIPIRGHVLVWPGPKHLPPAVVAEHEAGTLTAERVRTITRDWFEEVAPLAGPHTVEWDVINEVHANHLLMDIAGEGIMSEWFRWAEELMPGQQLYLNEYNVLQGRDLYEQQSSNYARVARLIKDDGAPIHGLGFQCHFTEFKITPPVQALKILDRFGEIGLDHRVTEFDMHSYDRELIADYVADLLTVVFSHPNSVGFQLWEFWESAMGVPRGAFYDADWNILPPGQRWLELTRKQWWTDRREVSDAAGRAGCRA